MTMDAYSVNVVPGAGAVGRWPSVVVVAGGDQTEALDLVAELEGALGPEPTAGAVVDLFRSGPRFDTALVDIAAAVSTPEGVRVFVRGAMQVRTETDELIAGPAPVERDLPAATALWLGGGEPPTAQGHPAMDLRRGVVTGEGVVVHKPATQQLRTPIPSPASEQVSPRQVEPPPAPPETIADRAEVVSRPFEAIEWDGPAAVETREPLEVLGPESVELATELAEQLDDEKSDERRVLGIYCSRAHFNNPSAGYCQVCGISMVHLTHRLEPGLRPTLGFVVFADGATYAVDCPYLIGRSPLPSNDSGLTPLPTQDATQSVSREHAQLRLEDWDVTYVDLGSTNGSFLWNAPGRRWDPIQPNVPVVLASGTTVSVGRMTFVFEGASKAVGGQ